MLGEVEMGSGGASLFVPLFSFNLGLETGQLAGIVVGLSVLWVLRKRSVFVRAGEPVFSLVALALGAYWLAQRILS